MVDIVDIMHKHISQSCASAQAIGSHRARAHELYCFYIVRRILSLDSSRFCVCVSLFVVGRVVGRCVGRFLFVCGNERSRQ